MKKPAKAADSVLAEMACACATVRQAARAITQLYNAWLRDSGFEAPQFALLMALDKGGPQPQSSMSQRFAIDKTTLSRNLRLLESRGWIEPAKGNDRRERRFGITPAGRERIHSAYPAWNRAQADLKSAMTASEWNQMFRAFRTAARVAIDRRSRISRGEKIA